MKRILALSTAIVLAACSAETESAPSTEKQNASQLDGKKIMEDKCFSCHNTQGTDNMLAPPMFRVKDHYWDEEITKEQFVDDVVNWVMDPKEENSVMPGARRKFGLMPKQNFNREEVAAIAEYMFENDL